MSTTEITITPPEPVAPKVPAGLATYFGVLVTILSAVGTVVAAVEAQDTATITAGVTTILTALTTIGGRMAQAVALARQVATTVDPLIDAIAAGEAGPVDDPDVDAVSLEELPTDEDEFAAPPPLQPPADR